MAKEAIKKKSLKEGNTSRSFVLLSALTVGEKILGFVLQATIAAVLGATIVTDCYYATFEITTLIDMSLVAAITVVLLKQYADEIVNNGDESAALLLSNARSLILPGMFGLSLLILLFAQPISYMLAPGYQASERSLLIDNIRWLAFLPMINTTSLFYVVILRQKKRFLITGLKSLFINIFGFIGIGCYILFHSKTSFYLCLTYNFGLVIYGIVAFAFSRRWNRLRIVKPEVTPQFRAFLKMLLPLVISNGIVRLSLLVDRIISSMMGEGAVTCLTYAHMLSYFVEGVFIINISTVLLSDFINLAAKNDNESIKNKLRSSLSIMIIILLPISVITVIFSKQITSIVFYHGNFSMNDVDRVATLISFYAIGFVPSVISNIYMQTHYAFGKTRTTLNISMVSIVSNIVISIVLASIIGLSGIAIGTCMSYIISGSIYSKKIGEIVEDYRIIINWRFLLSIFISASVCVGIALLIRGKIESNLLSFVCASVLGIGAYVVCLVIVREQNVITLLNKGMSIIKKQ